MVFEFTCQDCEYEFDRWIEDEAELDKKMQCPKCGGLKVDYRPVKLGCAGCEKAAGCQGGSGGEDQDQESEE